jgi:hypothetical protein
MAMQPGRAGCERSEHPPPMRSRLRPGAAAWTEQDEKPSIHPHELYPARAVPLREPPPARSGRRGFVGVARPGKSIRPAPINKELYSARATSIHAVIS